MGTSESVSCQSGNVPNNHLFLPPAASKCQTYWIGAFFTKTKKVEWQLLLLLLLGAKEAELAAGELDSAAKYKIDGDTMNVGN